MELYIIRHAEAAPAADGGAQTDAERPLTPGGIQQARALAAAFRGKKIELHLVLSSPFLRARQTAEELLHDWPAPRPQFGVFEELALGGKRRKLLKALREHGVDKVAIVGHEPELGELTAFLIGSKKLHVELDKAAVACLVCNARLNKGAGRLRWLVTPDWYGV